MMSDLLSGDYRKTIVVGGKVYVMRAPSIKVIARATRYFSLVDIPREASVSEMFRIASGHSENIVQGLAYLVVGDTPEVEKQVPLVAAELRAGTHEELCSAFLVAFNLVTGKELFQCASLAMELATLIARPR